ncbi:MAG TPA: CHASE2 domain-containing protein, partial [Gammaproteobacteria bacterium]|nr:CHASE2 domain-containing protein [Gammaproteobacteria bacterium]
MRHWARRVGLTMGRTIATALLALLVFFRWLDPAPVETLRLKIFDFYLNLFPRSPTAQPVAVVDIDEESLAEIGQWPWPRTLVAELIHRIQAAG